MSAPFPICDGTGLVEFPTADGPDLLACTGCTACAAPAAERAA